MTKEEKMKIVINNYFKTECSVNTSIREAFEKGFRIGASKVQPKRKEDEAYKKGFKDGKQAAVDAVGNLMVACGDGSTLEDANNIYYNEILADICMEIENKVKIGVMQNE